MKDLKTIKAVMVSADFKENTITFKVENPVFKYGSYEIVEGEILSKLLKQCNELLEALDMLLKSVDEEGWCDDEGHDYEEQEQARKLINNIKQTL